MDKNILVANPRKLRSIFDAFCCAAVEAAGIVLFYFLKIDNPVTVGEKTLQTVYVCFMLVLTLFMGFTVVCSLRSLYPRAILTVTDDRVILEKKREITFAELSEAKTEKDGGKLVIKSVNGDVITLNRGDVNVPLETLCYAINLRAEEYRKNSTENGENAEEKI